MAQSENSKKPKVPKKKPSEVSISYRLSRLSILEFQVNDLSEYDREKSEPLDFTHFLNGSITDDGKQATVKLRTIIAMKRGLEQPLPLSSLTVDVVFDVDGIERLPVVDNEAKIPRAFQVALGAAAIGTVRGIFWTKLQGTRLAHVIVPLIDPATLGEKMVTTDG